MKKLIYRTPWWSPDYLRPKDKLSLNRNENCDRILIDYFRKNFISQIKPKFISQYPDIGGAYLALEKIAQISHQNLYLTSGSEQAIRAIFHLNSALKRPNKKITIIFPAPTFGLVEIYARLYRFKITKIKYQYQNHQFFLNYQKLLKNQADLIYLANPDNPTGQIIKDDILEKLRQTKKIVILDQAYFNFTKETKKPAAYFLNLIKKYPNLYLIRSFSKDAGGAGLRIGYIIAAKNNIKKLYEDKPLSEINSLACEFLKFIGQKPKIISQSVKRLNAGKNFLEKRLKSQGYQVASADGNFTLVEYDQKLFEKISKKAKVSVLTIASQKFIRITAADPKTIRKIL